MATFPQPFGNKSLFDRKRLKVDLQTFSNIKFWLFVSVALHFTAITQPPLETYSQWRQAHVLMIARNFYEGSHNIFYPTTDNAGNLTGIVGGGFPLLNYLIYLLSIPFGFHDWFGRLINVLVSTVGVYFYYRLIRDAFGEKTAFCSSLILLTSLWFAYSRVSVTHTFAASLCFISLYYGIRYLKEPTFSGLVLFFVPGLLGCLSSLSAASLMTVMVIPVFFGDGLLNAKLAIIAMAAAILVGAWTWYFVWWPYLNTYGFTTSYYHGSTLAYGATLLATQWAETLKRFYFTAFKYSGFIVFIGGLYFVVKTKNRLLFFVFVITFVSYAIIVMKIAVGFNVDLHYMVMFLPPMALVAGYGIAQLNSKLWVFLLVIVAAEGIGNQIHEFRIKDDEKVWLELEEIMDTVSKRDDLVAITGMIAHDPVPMYMAHRRGWVIAPADLSDSKKLNDLVSGGCKYFVVASMYSTSTLDLPLVHKSEDFAVYRATADDSTQL